MNGRLPFIAYANERGGGLLGPLLWYDNQESRWTRLLTGSTFKRVTRSLELLLGLATERGNDDD